MLYLKRQIVILWTKRIRLNFLSKLLDLKSDFTLTLGYLNPALKNPALVSKISLLATISQVKAGKGQPLRKLTLET